MDNRFRREQSLSYSSRKKTHIDKHSDFQKKESQDPSTFVQYFLDSYKKVRQSHIMRDTVLLLIVLFSILLTVSWALPRVFSFHFDVKNIVAMLS